MENIVIFAVMMSALLAHGCRQADPAGDIWVAAWTTVPREASSIVPMVRVAGDFRPGINNVSLDPEAYADRLKRLPRGRRALFWGRYSHSLWVPGTDQIQTPSAQVVIADPAAPQSVQEVKREWTRFLELVKYCGGEVEHLIGDNEDWGRYKTWSIKEEEFRALCSHWQSVGDSTLRKPCDTPYTEVLRPGSAANIAWNLAVGRSTAQSMTEAIWKPALAIFPSLVGSNFDGVRTLDRPSPDLNGHAQPWDNIVGNRAAPSIYGQVQQAADAWFVNPKNPRELSRTGTARLSRSPWTSLLIDVQQLRAARRGTPAQPLTPWIALRTFRGDVPGSVGYPDDPRYYLELLRHAALTGTEYFLWWNSSALPPEARAEGPDLDGLALELSHWIDGINRDLHGKVVECCSSEPVSFDADFVLSGAKCSDGLIRWRVTARPNVRALKDRSDGTTLTIPTGEVGLWITRKATASPPDLEAKP
jgi:hypothetical protein